MVIDFWLVIGIIAWTLVLGEVSQGRHRIDVKQLSRKILPVE